MVWNHLETYANIFTRFGTPIKEKIISPYAQISNNTHSTAWCFLLVFFGSRNSEIINPANTPVRMFPMYLLKIPIVDILCTAVLAYSWIMTRNKKIIIILSITFIIFLLSLLNIPSHLPNCSLRKNMLIAKVTSSFLAFPLCLVLIKKRKFLD